jgi:hypothetical protein
MFGIAAIVAFAVALILNVFSLSRGHFDWQALMLAGLLCFAIHLYPAGPWWPRRG